MILKMSPNFFTFFLMRNIKCATDEIIKSICKNDWVDVISDREKIDKPPISIKYIQQITDIQEIQKKDNKSSFTYR